MDCPVIQLYRDAVKCLQVVSNECEKENGGNLKHMLEESEKCSKLLGQIKEMETDLTRLAGIEQLTIILRSHQAAFLKSCDTDEENKRCSLTDSLDDEHVRMRRQAVEDTIVAKGKLRFEDVAGLIAAKQTLHEAIIMPVQYPHLFTGGREPWKRILLYGPPGTGKSRLAQAISSEINSTFYCVSSADLVSHWVGESEKIIKELFHHAKNQKGRSVIFIDEIDSVCRKRSMQEEEYTRRIKTELLKQMEGSRESINAIKIFLLCATNCPWELDSAFIRRFQKRIYIPLPDRNARITLMKIHLKENAVSLSDEDLKVLADKTEGFSGSDISNVVLGALFEPIRYMQKADYWRHIKDGKWMPCEDDYPGALKTRLVELPPEQVQPKDLVLGDFLSSLEKNRGTVTKEELKKFEDFTNSFGQNG